MHFWLDNIKDLFKSINVIPRREDCLEEQFNSITRLVLLIWVIMYMSNYKNNELFLLQSLFFIIIFYYIQKNMISCQENYTLSDPNEATIPISDYSKLPRPNNLKALSPSQYRFCLDEREVIPNSSYYSTNQALAGPPNPKTNVCTPIVAPCYSYEYWMNDYAVPSIINETTNTDLYQSGYIPKVNDEMNMYVPFNGNTNKPYCPRVPGNPELPKNNNDRGFNLTENYSPSYTDYNTPYAISTKTNDSIPMGINPIDLQYNDLPRDKVYYNQKGTTGDMITCNNYNPKQLVEHNIPSNLPAGNCTMKKEFNEYNKNLYTNTLQPNLYVRNEVTQPIQSNLGISFTQQFLPVTCESDSNGDGTTYVNRDPRIYYPENLLQKPTPDDSARIDNVYDPRFHGYGTSYRSYIDELTGQPRFFYDDVDAIRKPNYLVRSNIDQAKWAQSYGPIDKEKTFGSLSSLYRPMAQNEFLQDNIKFREDMQERWMRKYNTQVGWQKRQAPINVSKGAINLIR